MWWDVVDRPTMRSSQPAMPCMQRRARPAAIRAVTRVRKPLAAVLVKHRVKITPRVSREIPPAQMFSWIRTA